jgi:hypothetical protein
METKTSKPRKTKTKFNSPDAKPAAYAVAVVVFADSDWTAGVVTERLKALIQGAEGKTAMMVSHILSQPKA